MSDEDRPSFRPAAERMAEEAFQGQQPEQEPKAKQQRSSPEGADAAGSGTTPQSREEANQERIPAEEPFQLIKDQRMSIGTPPQEMSSRESEVVPETESNLRTLKTARQNDSDEMQLVRSRLTV